MAAAQSSLWCATLCSGLTGSALLEWCVVPNNVHVLVKQRKGFPLADIVKSWKAYTARWANEILGRSGPFWMRDYHDRRIRDEKHMNQAVACIRNNPVKAGLCERPEDWPWSAAGREVRASLAGNQGVSAPPEKETSRHPY